MFHEGVHNGKITYRLQGQQPWAPDLGFGLATGSLISMGLLNHKVRFELAKIEDHFGSNSMILGMDSIALKDVVLLLCMNFLRK